MAQFPQGLSRIDKRCNPGERRVLHQLKRCLGDDYLVWHDVPIGPKARQPDFVILSPRQGLLLLEVKDWRASTLRTANRDSVELQLERGIVTAPNPIRQARDVTMELMDLIQQDPALVHGPGPFQGKLLFPYGWGAVFSNIRQAELQPDFETIFPTYKTLLRDDLDEAVPPADFLNRLWGLFSVSYPHTLTVPQRDRIRWHLFPEVRVQPAQTALAFEDAAAPLSIQLPELMQVMDLQQEQIARTLGEGHRVIHGAAGSGKTMILIFRAQQLAAAARADRPILVLCFNRALAGRIDALLRQRGVDERVQVRTFHAWCEDMVRSYQLDIAVPREARNYFEVMADTVDRAVQSGFIPGGQYTALLIDEAHDFEDAWLRMATRLIDPNSNSLLVLYDDVQSIYRHQRRKFNFASVGIDATGRTSILKLNYRNTAEILALATHCAQQLLQAADDSSELLTVCPASAGRRGQLPVLIEARSAREEAELLAERIAAQLAQGTEPSDIAVLYRTKYLMQPLDQALQRRKIPVQSMGTQAIRHFNWQTPSVKLITLHSAKGLEFSSVYIGGLQAMPYGDENLDDELRLLYVGMTRATHALMLSAQGRSLIVDRVRTAIDAVRGGFASELVPA
jgi:hypothetical protein